MTAPDGTDSNVFVMIGAYGKIIDPEKDEFFKKMLTDKNPYLV
jgi:flavorubredoxin